MKKYEATVVVKLTKTYCVDDIDEAIEKANDDYPNNDDVQVVAYNYNFASTRGED